MGLIMSNYTPDNLVENYTKLYNFVRYIAKDYVELSHEKVRLQRDDYMRDAKKLLNEVTFPDEN